ncbi:MAG: DeoR/GlpR family DNA-binding transcription regulator, partial [Spirochaetales bacterium]|nr:DeoR/GlpR family DNA-binding transcription regulator [Spirochaetales bacterium]
ELAEMSRLTVISNNAAAICNLETASGCEMILTGGTLRSATGCLVGEETLSRLSLSYPTTTIIGIDGISLRRGLSSNNSHEAAVSRKMIEQTAGRVIVAADSSKIGSLSLHHVASISSVTTLITDALPDPSMKEDFTAAGVEVIVLDDLE